MTLQSKILVPLHQLFDHTKSFFQSLRLKPFINKRVVFTVSIGAIGISIAANYYFHLLSVRKKRILNKSHQLIQMIPELNSPNVRIKNPNYVELVLSNLIHSGKNRLQVVSDFDRTISLHSYNGQPCPTSNAVLEMSRFVNPEIREKFQKLRDYYLPIEHNTSLSKSEKLPYMIEWWEKSLALTVETQLERNSLTEIVSHSVKKLKDGCKWFFYTLERYDVPLLIFSAGLGDIIQEWVIHECGSFKNMKIVSNFMKFDEKSNKICGFQGSIIHIFNKNEGVLLCTEYEKLIKNRPNVILLGDSLGDVDMAAGFPSLNNILKIGFLNDKENELLPKYMDAFDIVTIKDDTFNVPNAILRSII